MYNLNSFFAKIMPVKFEDPFPLGKPNPEWLDRQIDASRLERLVEDDLGVFNGGGFPKGEPAPDFFDFG